jgi:hypothetical protein
MAQAQRLVSGAAADMANAPARAGIAEKFDRAMGDAARSAKRFQTAIGATQAAIAAARLDLEGFVNNLPGAFGLVAGSMFALGRAIREAITGEIAAAKKEMEDLQLAATQSGLKAEARDVDRLTEIVKAQSDEQRIELERRREIALARQQLLKLEEEGATQEAIALVKAKERLANEKARAALADVQAAKRKSADEAHAKQMKEYDQRRAAQDEAANEISDIGVRIRMAGTADPMKKAALQYELDLREIRRKEIEDRENIGEMDAAALRRKREELLYAEGLAKADEIRAKQAEEALKADKERLGKLKSELGEIEKPGGFTQSISSSIGGSFRVANLSAAGEQVRYAERTASLAEQIKTLVQKIEGKIATEPGFA